MIDLPLGFDVFIGNKKYRCLLNHSTFSNKQETETLSLQVLEAVKEQLNDGWRTHVKKILKNTAWFFWPTMKQFKERGLDCQYEQHSL